MRRILFWMLVAVAPAATGCSTGSDGNDGGSSGQFPLLFGEENGNCTQHTKVSFGVDETKAKPPLELRIESCRMDVDACMDLCTYEVQNLPEMMQLFGSFQPEPDFNGGPLQGGQSDGSDSGGDIPVDTQPSTGITPTACSVTFDGSTANADISFDSFSDTSGCGFAEPGTTNGEGGASPPAEGGP